MADGPRGGLRISGGQGRILAALFLATLLPRIVLFLLGRLWDPASLRTSSSSAMPAATITGP
jgi:hypothetical protein